MKNVLLALAIVAMLSGRAWAAFAYWDTNGATAGSSGGTTASGTWSSSGGNWSTSSAGTVATGNWVSGNSAVFSAGTNATSTVAGSTITVTGTQTVGPTSGSASVTIEEGLVTLTGTGSVAVGTGIVRLNAGTELSIDTVSRMTFTAGGSYSITGDAELRNTVATGGSFIDSDATVAISSGATLTANYDVAGQTANIANVISGAGGVRKTGVGRLDFDSINTYSGGTTIDAGTLDLDADSTLGNGAGTLDLSGGTLRVDNRDSITAPANPVANPINLTSSSAITTGSISFQADVDFTSNSISGTGGTLTFRNDGADAATDFFEPRFSGSGFTFSRPIVIDNGAIGKTRLTSSNTTGTTQTFSGVISGTGSYRRSVTGVADNGGDTILSGANTYAGGTELDKGFIGFGSDTAISTGTLTIANSADVGFFASGGSRTVANPITVNGGNTKIKGANDLTMSGAVDLGGGIRTFTVTNTGATTFSGVISNGGLTKEGASGLSLSGANTYSGATTVNAGTLKLGASGVISDSSAVSLANVAGANLDVNGQTETIASLAGGGASGGNVQLGSGILTVGDATSTSYAGVISGSGGQLVKQGAGALSLNGANTYSGATAINAGILNGTGSLAGAVNVNAAGALGGMLTVSGPVTVTGGTVAPGQSPGTLTINNNLMLDSASALAYELLGTDQTPGGTNNDLITGVQDLTLAGTLNVMETSVGSFLSAQPGDKWRLINYAGSLTGTLTLGAMPTLSNPSYFFKIETLPNQVNLLVVPEPSTMLMALLGTVGLLGAARRRQES